LLGKEISTVTSGKFKSGKYSFVIDGSQLSSGVYFMRIKSDTKSQMKKIIFIK